VFRGEGSGVRGERKVLHLGFPQVKHLFKTGGS
jgi:hypothetical protein